MHTQSRRLGAVALYSFAVISALATLIWVGSSAIAVNRGEGPHLLTARAGHTATALPDGALLIAGGVSRKAFADDVELFDLATAKAVAGPKLLTPRMGHTATMLADGRILLAGGRNSGGQLDSSELYDPASGAIEKGAMLNQPRSGHTATRLADGRVLFAGGNDSGEAEIFDPKSNAFYTVGKLGIARAGHAAILLKDGKVLLAGGYSAAAATAELFDPVTLKFTAVRGGMRAARVQPGLNLLPDGKVQVVAGDGETTMELYNPDGYFTSKGHLVRDGASVWSTLRSPARGALMNFSKGLVEQCKTDALGGSAKLFERTQHSITSVWGSDKVVVAGGFAKNGTADDSIVVLTSCTGTVTTDLTDYHPGEYVTMSGAGWMPGEEITLTLHRDTDNPPDTILHATADENGNWTNSEYLVQELDAWVTFDLTAEGDSGCTAQTTFTDSVASVTITSPTTASPFAVTTLPTTMNVTFSYVASPTGPTTATIDVLGSGGVTVGPITIPDGSGSQTIAVTLPAGLGTGNHNLKVTVDNSVGGSSKQANDVQNNAITSSTTQATTTTLGSSLNPSTYGASVTFTATVATSPGGTPVTVGSVSIYDGGTCAVPGTLLTGPTTPNGSGQVSVSLSSLTAGAHNLIACYVGSGSFTSSNGALTQNVNKATLTVTGDNQSRDYGAANPAFTYTITGFVLGQSVATAPVTGAASCTTTATAISTVAGSPYPITCTIGTLAAANYDFTFAAGQLTITTATLTVTADNQSRDYGAANPAFTYAITGFVNSETVVTAPVTGAASCTTTATAISTVAGSPYPINCTIGTLAAANYDFTFVAGQLTITTATLTVTADNQSRDYGAANPAFTYAITGFVNSETVLTAPVTGAASCTTTATATSTVAGSPYPINCTIGTLAAANYDFSFVAGELTITTATLTVTADNQSRDYGAANPAFTYAITGFVNSETVLTAPVTGAASCTTTATATSTVAGSPYPINCTIGTLAAANYDFSFVAGELTITAATLTVTADNQSRDYGAANPAFTYAITGFVNGDTELTAVTGAASCTTTATATSTVAGSPYPINCTIGTLAAANYDFSFVAGELTITTATLTVTADNQSRDYGAADPAFTYTITGFVLGQSVATAPVTGAASCTTTATATSTVAGSPYPINCTIGTLAAANYDFSFVAGELTITTATLTVTADNQSRDYGAANPAFTYAITGFVNGDTELTAVTGAASCTTTATATSTVAGSPYPINCTIGTLAAANYDFSFVAGELTITTATLTVTADNQSRDYGAANPAFTYAITGFVNSETVLTAPVTGAASCTTTATGTSTVAGSPYPINCTIGTLAAANYDFSFAAGQLTITTATLTVTADNQSRDYGAANPAFTYAITGFVNGETVVTAPVTGAASCTTTATAISTVAGSPYPINCTIGTLAAANYDFTFAAGQLTITTATLTVTAANKSRSYGAANPTLTYTITGFANGETVVTAPVTGAASCTTTATAISTVAGSPYPINCTIGTLAAANYDFAFAAGGLTVTPATLTVTADNKSRAFLAPDPAFTYVITGFVNGETVLTAPVTGTASCTTTATALSPVGTYPITCTIGTLAAANYNFTFVAGTLTIGARAALVNYIGQQVFVTSGSSATTAQVTLSASVQDPTGTALAGATMTFIDITNNKVLAANVPVATVQNQPNATGTANKIVTLSTGQYGAESYLIRVVMTGNYDNTDQPTDDKTATVVVAKPAITNETIGAGEFVGLGSSAGVYKGAVGEDGAFTIGLKYNKGGANLQGKITVSVPQTDGSVVYFKSNSISSMAVTNGNPKTSTIYTKSTVYRVMPDASVVTIDGNVTLRIDVEDGTTDKVGVTVLSSKDSTLFYSNQWLLVTPPAVWKTVPEAAKAGGFVTIN